MDVTFDLAPADQSPLIEGGLHLQWIGRGHVVPITPVPLATPGPESIKNADPFKTLAAAVEKLRPEQLRELKQDQRSERPTQSKALHPCEVRPASG